MGRHAVHARPRCRTEHCFRTVRPRRAEEPPPPWRCGTRTIRGPHRQGAGMTHADLQFAVHLGPDDMRDALRADALACLTSTPKELPPKWFYDDRGSELFDAITRLPEYYPTRRERE